MNVRQETVNQIFHTKTECQEGIDAGVPTKWLFPDHLCKALSCASHLGENGKFEGRPIYL